MDSDLAELASSAASTLVKQLTTEAWQGAVKALGALWRKVHPERADTVEAEAAETREAALAGAAEAELVAEWQGRLRRLLLSDPGVVEDVRRLLGAEPAAGAVTVRVRASGHSRVAVAGRDVQITGS